MFIYVSSSFYLAVRLIFVEGVWGWEWSCKILRFNARRRSRLWRCCRNWSFLCKNHEKLTINNKNKTFKWRWFPHTLEIYLQVFDLCQKMRALAVLFRRGRTPPMPENLKLNLRARKRSLEDQDGLKWRIADEIGT